MSSIFGIGTALTPVGGQQSDSASEIAQRKRQTAASQRFSTTDEAGEQTAPKTGLLQKTRDAAGAAISQLMRRRTDRGEPAAEAGSIEIPPHLERRRAWREAFGLNTWHTQQIAQTEETPISDEARAEAIQAYRSGGRRGRLDLDLAQQVSMNV
ncbi:hypothetical protein FNB15_20695 [Ferrovibrio terrae]|uniref:Uncharacterized protein n=1 Tax=Ferrovibrio terrae TaxID=2594003 RepID=A0A516H6Y6_9PROT|nr:hypothetical protein [Ferrovibrio terrae]QDO99534.1 hypothetical protein FNB15_20695 [Ferrovibrio terrae]